MSADAIHLLIPIHVDALTVSGNESASNRAPLKYGLVNAAADYSRLRSSDMTAADLRHQEITLQPGVHLHFRLPSAVAHGDLQKVPAYPRIPNRWLVQRHVQRGGTPAVKAWLVCSDKQAQDAKDKESAVVLLVRPAHGASGSFVCRPTGVARVIWEGNKSAGHDQWLQDNAPAEVELTAVTGGDAGFSAHYPACRSILGLHDDLSDLNTLPDGQTLQWSYMVTGWYSAVADDPWHALVGDLAGTPWDQLSAEKQALIERWMDERGCTVDFSGRVVPSGILCHGLIEGVRHPLAAHGAATGAEPFAGFEDPRAHWVDVGHTSAEALAARVATLRRSGSHGRNAYDGDFNLLEDLVTALQVGLFSQGASAAELDAELHRQGFSPLAGGRIWEIRQGSAAQAEHTAPTPPLPSPSVPRDLQASLDALNKLEEQCARREALLRDYQWELYALWHRWTQAGNRKAATSQRRLQPALETLKKFVPDFEVALKLAQGQRQGVKSGIEDKLAQRSRESAGSATYSLIDRPLAPYYAPKDPVVLLTGPAAQATGTQAQRSPVRVRVTGDELQRFAHGRNGVHDQELTADEVAPDVPRDFLALIPPWSARLLLEALLLEAAQKISADGNSIQFPEQPRHVPPDAFGRFRWRHNPWIPLYLHWSVSWSADKEVDPSAQHMRLQHDASDAAPYRRNHDLTTAQPIQLAPGGQAATYTGLCFVGSPLFSRQFARTQGDGGAPRQGQREMHSLLKQIDEVLGSRPSAMISQALSGLHHAFMMQREADQLPPLDRGRWADPARGNPLHLDPIAHVLGPDFHPLHSPLMAKFPADPPPPFSPLRGGVLQLDNLWIIDAFGQRTLVPHSEHANVSGRLSLQNQPAFRMRPRFCRPMRLDFTGMPAGAASVDSVCGWVVLNRFDQNLVLYAADGQPVGILQKRFHTGGSSGKPMFYWAAVPGTQGTQATVAGIRNPHLLGFAEFVLSLNPEAGQAFDQLLNEAIEATHERTAEDNPLLSAILGRPLALVRARLDLKTMGLPALNQNTSWNQTSNPQELDEILAASLRDGLPPSANRFMVTGGVESVRWHVRLGDRRSARDGLVGFFKGEPATGPFYPAWGFDLGTQSYAGIEPEQDLQLDCQAGLQLTLLMDPQARVHATTGVLPKTALELAGAPLKGLKQVREVYFQTAPVLGTATTPHVPTPSDDFGQWSWTFRPNVTGWAEDPNMVSAAQLADRSVGWPTLSEGWLKLRTEPVLIKSLWLKAPVGKPGKKMNFTLAWSLHGAETVELLEVRRDGTEQSKQRWSAPPLGAEWTGSLEADSVFRLRAANAAGWEDFRDIEIQIEE